MAWSPAAGNNQRNKGDATPDVRAKLTTKAGASLEDVFPGASAGPMKYLGRDRGIVFPYVPTIMMSHQATYGTHQPIHSNFVYKYFQNYALQEFTVTCDFTAHTATEGRYMEGAMHFIKSAMKMGFGEKDPQRGVPPPVLEFSAWGQAWAKRIPVIISNFTFNIDGATDYVWPLVDGQMPTFEDSMMPLRIQFILNLGPTYSTRSTRTKFTSGLFYSGALLKHGYS